LLLNVLLTEIAALLIIKAKCVDVETGKPAKRGERGELWVRAANIVKGYFQNEEATKETITEDGWLKTGDVAVVDEDGDFSIVDRIKELIKVKGSQVAPAELEGLLLTHPKIAAAAVVGVYDRSQATEWPRAYIELKDGRKSQKEEAELAREFTEYVKKKASGPKQLKGGVRFLDKVPASPSGKLLRKDLRALVKQEEDQQQSSSAHL
jgi:acyl-CoA synthetase (AMP-forming)/AMP-acid ligase II